MAGIKIVDLPPLGRDLASTDLLELSLAGGTGSRKITGQEIMNTSKLNIGTTAITSGTVGRILFEGTGNVVQESAGITWDNTNAVFSLGTLFTKIINFKPADTTSVFGNTSSIRGGQSGRIDFLNASNLTHIFDGTVIVGPTAGPYIQVGSTSIAFAIGGTERARIAPTTGNVLINTTTDAGFRLDVNGTARTLGVSHFRGPANSVLGSNLTTSAPALFYQNTFSGVVAIGSYANGGGEIQSAQNGGLTVGGSLFIQRQAGNVIIGSSTDDGFRLDVNGTARVQGVLTIGGEIFGATNTYFNGPSLNTGTLWLRFNAVNSNGNFTATGPVQGTNVIASGTNSQLSSTGSGVQGVLISNTATSTNWRIEGHRTTSGALEFKNDLTNPVLNLFSTRNVGIGTFTDAGFRLDVNGTARVKSTGNTSATTGFTILNSSSTAWFSVRDDGRIQIGTTGAQTFVQGATTFQAQTAADNMVVFQGGLTTGTFFRTYLSGTDYPLEANANGLTIRSSGNTAQNSSSILDVQSTTRGFLPPRMTQTQRNAIASPAIGLEIYQTDATEGKYIYKSSGWTYIG